MIEYTKTHREEILASIIKSKKTDAKKYREKFENYSEDHQRKRLVGYKFYGLFYQRRINIDKDELKKLTDSLSAGFQKKMKEAAKNGNETQVLRAWMQSGLRYVLWRPPSDEKLRELLGKLPEEDRKRLLELDPDEMRSQLMKRYYRHYRNSRRGNRERSDEKKRHHPRPPHRKPEDRKPRDEDRKPRPEKRSDKPHAKDKTPRPRPEDRKPKNREKPS